MVRRRATGIALVLVSAAAFGSGSLFAQPVYAAGVDWMTLSAWRFLFGASLTWMFLLVSAERRRGFRGMDRRAIVAAIGLGVLYVGNSGTYYAALETVSASLAALVVSASHVYFFLQQPYLRAIGVPLAFFGGVFAATKVVTALVATGAHRIEARLGVRGRAGAMVVVPVVEPGVVPVVGVWVVVLVGETSGEKIPPIAYSDRFRPYAFARLRSTSRISISTTISARGLSFC